MDEGAGIAHASRKYIHQRVAEIRQGYDCDKHDKYNSSTAHKNAYPDIHVLYEMSWMS